MKKYTFYLFTLLMYSCAQYAAPTGGKKDEKPPKLLSSSPSNKQTNVVIKEILLNFDELVNTTSLKQDLIITPKPLGQYVVKNKGKNIEIKFDSSFKQNTTYTLNFRNGIKDLTESNPSTDLKLIFSTGSKLDSMSYSGLVKHAYTQLPILGATVGLYEIKDTNSTAKPYYFTKTDSSGKFKFDNLRSISYNILVFTDKNNNLIFDEKNEDVDFLSETLKLTKHTKPDTFALFRQDHKAPKINRNQSRTDVHQITTDENIYDYKLKFEKDSLSNIHQNNQIYIFNHPSQTDSVKATITLMDSSGNVSKHPLKFKFKEENKKKKNEYFALNSSITNNEAIKNTKDLYFKLDRPIIIDTAKISVLIDSVNTKAKIKKVYPTLQIDLPLNFKKTIKIKFSKGFAISTSQDTSAASEFKYTLAQKEDFGQVSGKINSSKQHNKIVELIDTNNKIVQTVITKQFYNFQYIKEGTYFVRTILDLNNDKKWTTGDTTKKLKPEPVFISKELNIKSNFDIEDFDISTF